MVADPISRDVVTTGRVILALSGRSRFLVEPSRVLG